jgi:hypothetical protein
MDTIEVITWLATATFIGHTASAFVVRSITRWLSRREWAEMERRINSEAAKIEEGIQRKLSSSHWRAN